MQTIPNKLPDLLIKLSSQGPHLLGVTLSTLLRAVHPGTIAMTVFRRGLRPRVLTHHPGDRCVTRWAKHVISSSGENKVKGSRRLANAAYPKGSRERVGLSGLVQMKAFWDVVSLLRALSFPGG